MVETYAEVEKMSDADTIIETLRNKFNVALNSVVISVQHCASTIENKITIISDHEAEINDWKKKYENLQNKIQQFEKEQPIFSDKPESTRQSRSSSSSTSSSSSCQHLLSMQSA